MLRYNPEAIKGVYPEFFERAVHMKFKSEQEGKAVYENRVFVAITVAGDPHTRVETEATEEHKIMYEPHWNAFCEKREPVVEGTPIENWNVLDPAMLKILQSLKIRTVEQMANLNEAYFKNIGLDARRLRDKAKEYINSNTERVQELEEQIMELNKKLEKLEKKESDKVVKEVTHTVKNTTVKRKKHNVTTNSMPECGE